MATEQQTKEIIELLREIVQKLDNIDAAIMMKE
jgi:hypothetical protein